MTTKFTNYPLLSPVYIYNIYLLLSIEEENLYKSDGDGVGSWNSWFTFGVVAVAFQHQSCPNHWLYVPFSLHYLEWMIIREPHPLVVNFMFYKYKSYLTSKKIKRDHNKDLFSCTILEPRVLLVPLLRRVHTFTRVANQYQSEFCEVYSCN